MFIVSLQYGAHIHVRSNIAGDFHSRMTGKLGGLLNSPDPLSTRNMQSGEWPVCAQ